MAGTCEKNILFFITSIDLQLDDELPYENVFFLHQLLCLLYLLMKNCG